jgi:hypothetical protein
MAKSENKTKVTEVDPLAYISEQSPKRQQESQTLLALMEKVTGEKPAMWGPSMIGFGTYHYKYASGREGDMFRCGFSPRKAALSIYVTCDIAQYGALLEKLGKHTTGKGCLYVKSLDDIDLKVLERLIKAGLKETER